MLIRCLKSAARPCSDTAGRRRENVNESQVTLIAFASASAHASGLYLYEIATEDTGLAGAGQAARAQDASTLMTNPAGMTRLPDRMLTGGSQALYGDTPFLSPAPD